MSIIDRVEWFRNGSQYLPILQASFWVVSAVFSVMLGHSSVMSFDYFFNDLIDLIRLGMLPYQYVQ